MKHMPLLFIFSLFLFVGCQESTKTSSSSNNNYGSCSPTVAYSAGSYCYCYYYPTGTGCSSTTGTTTSGTTGSTSCQSDYYTNPSCAGYCLVNPTASTCSGTTTGGTTTGTTTGGTTYNPYPQYYSAYVDKNWGVQYPYVPSISCADATAPSGISYTPYETRKATVTLKGQVDYNPASGQTYFDTTSELLRSVTNAQNFFWGDSTLKVRFKSNVQPSSANTSTVCPGRTTGQSSIKGYGRIKFDLYLVGKNSNNVESTVYLGNKTVDVNSCTSAIDLSSYAEVYTNGIYLRIQNVQGNQNWLPGNATQSQYYDTYGYVYPQNPYVSATYKAIRNAECWSLDIEVAADGTKTFN